MSAATAAPAEGEAPKKGPKKLIIIIAAVALLVVLGGGGAAFFLMKKKAADAAAAEADGEVAEETHGKEAPKPGKHGKDEHAVPPSFVPLDPFIVNLADRDVEHFAQIGLTLQVDDPKVAEELKTYMPAIRNSVLMILSHKTSEQLLSQEGKEQLATEIRRESARAMGYEVAEPETEAAPKDDAEADDEEDHPKKKKKKKKKKVEPYNPIVKVHYANFIIQ
ncbi:MAG: flagellar basal body rod protein [Rubrivivax sp.]|nr:MAG: flagellar basal body rod protein [Rubrivivax sp.]